MQATVEPGVINQIFRDTVEEKVCFILQILQVKEVLLGGNLAENSVVQKL